MPKDDEKHHRRRPIASSAAGKPPLVRNGTPSQGSPLEAPLAERVLQTRYPLLLFLTLSRHSA